MTAVIWWAMTLRRTTEYLLIDHVLVWMDFDGKGGTYATARRFATVEKARAEAILYTKTDEEAGYRLDGPVRTAETPYNPSTIATAYETRRLIGLQMLGLLETARDGRPL